MSDLIQLAKPTFPYRISQATDAANSVIRISRLGSTSSKPDLFFIDNASLSASRTGRFAGTASIQLRHSTARDSGRSLVYIANFELSLLQFVEAYDNTLLYQGLLKECRFYAEQESNPLAKLYSLPDEEYAASARNQPYLPPVVEAKTLKLPLEVEIAIEYNIKPYDIDGITELLS